MASLVSDDVFESASDDSVLVSEDDDFEPSSDDTTIVPDVPAPSDDDVTTGSIKADTNSKNVYVIYLGSSATFDNKVQTASDEPASSKNVSEDDSKADTGSKNLHLMAIYIVLGVLFLLFFNLAVGCTTSNIVDAVM